MPHYELHLATDASGAYVEAPAAQQWMTTGGGRMLEATGPSSTCYGPSVRHLAYEAAGVNGWTPSTQLGRVPPGASTEECEALVERAGARLAAIQHQEGWHLRYFTDTPGCRRLDAWAAAFHGVSAERDDLARLLSALADPRPSGVEGEQAAARQEARR